jgi:hypothetical protein
MRFRREILVIVAVIGGLATYWIGSEVHYARSISPKGVATVRDFFGRFGEPRRIRMVERDGKSYYEFTGQLPGSWSCAFPSAPAAYVFDEQGRFAAWCRDPGDASELPAHLAFAKHQLGRGWSCQTEVWNMKTWVNKTVRSNSDKRHHEQARRTVFPLTVEREFTSDS